MHPTRGAAQPRPTYNGECGGGSHGSLPMVATGGGGTLARYQEQRLAVNVCGRTVGVSEHCSSLMELQAQLQDELGMPDQVFEIFDNCGTRLLVDSDMREAVADHRMPLSASLSDASIHFIENRREELAQMQWKLVRDQHNQASSKLNVFSRQIQEMEAKIESQARTSQQTIQALRTELQLALEGVKDLTMNNSRQLSERIAGIGQLVQAERNMREVAVEKLGKSVQHIHDTIDGHRSSVRQGNDLTMTHVEGARKLIEAEREARAALEDKCERDLEHMGEKMDEVANALKAAMGEYGRLFEQSALESSNTSEKHARTTQKHRSEVDAAMEAQAMRLKILEERSATLEARLLEHQRRHADTLEKLSQRHEKVSSHLDSVKFSGEQHVSTIEQMQKRLAELETQVATTDLNVREVTDRERKQRVTEMMSLKEAIASEQDRLRCNLEGRIQTNTIGESHARAEMRQQIMESVSTALSQNKMSDLQSTLSEEGKSDVANVPHPRGTLPIANVPAEPVGRGSHSVPAPAQAHVGLPIKAFPHNAAPVVYSAQAPISPTMATPSQAPSMARRSFGTPAVAVAPAPPMQQARPQVVVQTFPGAVRR